MKKISTRFGILIIIAAVVVLVGGTTLISNYQLSIFNQTQNVQSSNTQTADWKTYTNNKYSFEIKYPQNYFQEIVTEQKTTDYLVYGKMIDLLYSNPEIYPNIRISYTPLTTEAFIQETKNAQGNVANVSMENLAPVTVNNKQAYTFQSGFTGMGEVCISNEALIPLTSGSLNILFNKCAKDECMLKECLKGDNFNLEFTDNEKIIFTRIISTFKFTPVK